MIQTICLDFDGVIHSYVSGWQGPRVIPDPPVPGAFDFICKAVADYNVAVFSTRSRYWGGRNAIRRWFKKHGLEVGPLEDGLMIKGYLSFPKHKPPALIYVDDRGWRFEGVWPTAIDIHRTTWNQG